MNKICREGPQQSKSIPPIAANTESKASQRLIIQVTNLADIFHAYGSAGVRHSLLAELQYRLISHLGLRQPRTCIADDQIVATVGTAKGIRGVNDDLFLEGIEAALCGRPIPCGEHLAVVDNLATSGTLAVNGNLSFAQGSIYQVQTAPAPWCT
jgi:hypothetical protein